jgi:hypothetical protein
MVVAQLTLTLGCHPALRLSHLVGIIRARSITLILVKVLDVGRRMGSGSVVLADGMMALRSTTHARVCFCQPPVIQHSCVVRTVIVVLARAAITTTLATSPTGHDRHRLTAAVCWRDSKAFSSPTLCEVVAGALHLCKYPSANVPLSGNPTQSPVHGSATHIPSNWFAKAFTSSRLTVELAPIQVSALPTALGIQASYLSVTAAGAVPRTPGARGPARKRRGRCSRPWWGV